MATLASCDLGFFQPVVIIVELIIFCSGYAGWIIAIDIRGAVQGFIIYGWIVVCCVGGLMKDRSDAYRHWICIS